MTTQTDHGRWQSYTPAANTSGGLSNDTIVALALGQDSTPWVGRVGNYSRGLGVYLVTADHADYTTWWKNVNVYGLGSMCDADE
jgi:hypothetical protein